MKTNKLFGLAALACGFAMSFTSCNNVDNPVLPPEEPEITIGFEDVTLNADGYWCGDKTGTLFSNYGQDAYACSYRNSHQQFQASLFKTLWCFMEWLGEQGLYLQPYCSTSQYGIAGLESRCVVPQR